MVSKFFLNAPAFVTAGVLLSVLSSSCRAKKESVQIPEIETQLVERCDYLESGKYTAKQNWYPLTEADRRELAVWLGGKIDWIKCSDTFAPRIVFKTKSFNLNVSGKVAVLNYEAQEGRGWRQVCADLQSSDQQFFERLKPVEADRPSN